ncbi:MAG TPA: hypothetical protein VMU43_09590 [Candidatus Acidoferrum sp.]|nr:hypothetical protein [Candidatus Acidoferrum sp.]
MKIVRVPMRLFSVILGFLLPLSIFAPGVLAQSAAGAGTSQQSPAASGSSGSQQQSSQPQQQETEHHSFFSRTTGNVQPGQPYEKPSNKVKFQNYLFDTFGPYPFIGSAAAAGIAQARAVPPEWGEGWDAYGVRTASYYGMTLISTTTRYGLAQVFHEDTLYYRCECKGVLPRLGHALISTVTARRGDDGHRVFSFSSLAAPYAGSMIATATWYPSRYEPMDGFRIGNYSLLYQAATNVALEFIYGGPHTLLSHTPLSSITGSSSSKTH